MICGGIASSHFLEISRISSYRYTETGLLPIRWRSGGVGTVGMMSSFVVRSATLEEIREIHWSWATLEGWNPGIEDWKTFSVVDPNGFLVGVLEGEVVTAISAIQLSSSYGFIGYYICKPEHRGKGYGLHTFKEAQKRLSHLASVGLDGVAAQIENYRKSGFKPAFQSGRHLYRKETEICLSLDERRKLKVFSADDSNLVNAALEMMSSLYKFRLETTIHSMLHGNGVRACVYYDMNVEDIAGWGMIRPATEGFRIGPLFAKRKDVANTIFMELVSSVPIGSNVYIHVPFINLPAIELMNQLQLSCTATCTRMYERQVWDCDIGQVFGLLSWEIGP